MKLWSLIKDKCYSRHASALKIYRGEKALGRASCVSEYEWTGELLIGQVFIAGVVLAFSNGKIYEVNSVYFRRAKLIALEVLLVWVVVFFMWNWGYSAWRRKGSWEHV